MPAWKNLTVVVICCFFISCSNSNNGKDSVDSPEKIGWLEKVELYPGHLRLVAKLDTGAKTSSINTAGYSLFKKNNEDWVRFTVIDKEGERAEFEKKVVRFVKIKKLEGDFRERPAVNMGILLGDTYCETEINLEDRRLFNYSLLLGRSYLKQTGFLVDSTSIFTTELNRNYFSEGKTK